MSQDPLSNKVKAPHFSIIFLIAKQIITENNGKELEARLLKFDISKAVHQLKWIPVLDFQKTVKLTVGGYLSDLARQSPIKNRLESIEYYLTEAISKKGVLFPPE